LLSPADKWIGFSSQAECFLKLASQVLAVVLSFIAAIHVGYLILEVLNFSSSSLAETRALKRRLFGLECAFLAAVIIIVSVRGADTIQFLGVLMICIGLVLFYRVQRKTARLCNELQTRLGANAAARDPTGTDRVFGELRRLYGFAVRSLCIGFSMLVCNVGTVTSSTLPSFHNSCVLAPYSYRARGLTFARANERYDEASNWNAPLAYMLDLLFLFTGVFALNMCIYTNVEALVAAFHRLRRAGLHSFFTASAMNIRTHHTSSSARQFIDPTAIYHAAPGGDTANSRAGFSIEPSRVEHTVVESAIETTVLVVDEFHPALTATGQEWKAAT